MKKIIKNYLINSLIVIGSIVGFAYVQTINIYPGFKNELKETYKTSKENYSIVFSEYDTFLTKSLFIKGEYEKPLIIYFHGNFELIDNSLNKFKEISKNTGVNVLMVEYNGYGESEGVPSLIGTTNNVKKWLKNNHSIKGLKEPKEQEIILWGRSIGTGHTLYFAEKNPELVDHIILQSGFMSPINALTDNEIITTAIDFLLFENYEADWKIDEISKSEELKSVSIVHGIDDQLFKIKYAQDLKNRFIKNGIEPYYIEYDGGHNSSNFDNYKIIDNIIKK